MVPILGALLGTVFTNVAAKVVPQLIEAVTSEIIKDNPKASTAVVAQKVSEAITKDPVLKNQLSLESPLQSGVTVGGLGALLAAIGTEVVLFSSGNFDPAVHVPNALVIVSTIYALYRRWSVTKPLGVK